MRRLLSIWSRRPHWAAPVLLFLFAFSLRYVGILWGGVHPDENFGAAAKVLSGKIIPDFHYYPPLLDYLCAAMYAFMFLLGHLGGFWEDTAAFRSQYFTEPAPFYFAARLVTILLASCAAPLTYLIAKREKASERISFPAGMAVAVIPSSVYLSHFNKSDVGLASSFVFAAWAYLLAVDNRREGASLCTADVLFSFACVLSISFKHSAVFFVFPLVAFYLLEVFRKGNTILEVAKHAAVFGALSAVFWAPLNIGIVLDFRNFLEFQRIQSLMSSRDFSFADFFSSVLPNTLVAPYHGLIFPAILPYAVFPFLLKRYSHLTLWLSSLIGLVVILYIGGPRIGGGLILPYVTLYTSLAAVVCAHAATATIRWKRYSGMLFLFLLLAVPVPYVYAVLRQSLPYETMAADVTSAVLSVSTPGETRVLGNPLLILYPQDPAAARDEHARDERLAKKYGVELPPLSEERAPSKKPFSSDATPLYVRRIPFVIGGLEVYEESEVEVIKPFAWPAQEEEYDLDYWIDQGFSVFVVQDEDAFINSASRFYRARHTEIRDRCILVETIPPKRPLFFESETKVYKLPADLERRARSKIRNAEHRDPPQEGDQRFHGSEER